MDRPVKEARTVLEPLEDFPQEQIDDLVNSTWNNMEDEEDVMDSNVNNKGAGRKDNVCKETSSNVFNGNSNDNIDYSLSNNNLKIRRRRSLSKEINADQDNPVLSFVRELINKSEREEVPIKYQELKDSVVSMFGIETFKRQSLAINLLFRSIEEQNLIHEELMSSNSRDRTLSVSSSQSQASSFGGYDSPYLSGSNVLYDKCIGCNDPEIEIQLKKHLLELESLF